VSVSWLQQFLPVCPSSARHCGCGRHMHHFAGEQILSIIPAGPPARDSDCYVADRHQRCALKSVILLSHPDPTLLVLELASVRCS